MVLFRFEHIFYTVAISDHIFKQWRTDNKIFQDGARTFYTVQNCGKQTTDLHIIVSLENLVI